MEKIQSFQFLIYGFFFLHVLLFSYLNNFKMCHCFNMIVFVMINVDATCLLIDETLNLELFD
jgi:hypothetical protein